MAAVVRLATFNDLNVCIFFTLLMREADLSIMV